MYIADYTNIFMKICHAIAGFRWYEITMSKTNHPQDIDAVSSEELRQLVLRVLDENARLHAENMALREEIARLKGLKGKPVIKPSGMDKGTA